MRAGLASTRLRLAAAVTALTFALRWPTFVVRRFFDPDEAAIGVQAMVVRAGGTLYVDVFDRKPPLPPLLYALTFAATGSADVRLARLAVTVGLAAAAVLAALDASRRLGPRAAWWAGALMVTGVLAFFPADAGAANYAHVAVLPGTAAMLWSRRPGPGWALAGGTAFGVAVLCRQSWLIAVAALALSCWRAGKWRSVALGVGAAAATVLTVGFYAPLSGFWHWTVSGNSGFVLAGADVAASAGRGAVSLVTFVAFHVAAVGGLVLGARRRNPVAAAGAPDRDLWLWLLTGLAAVATGLRFFGHYWIQVVPPVAVLAAPHLAGLGRRGRAWAAAAVAVPAVVAFAFLFVPGSFHGRPDPADLTRYVVSNTSGDDRVFVWGSYPELLLRAERLPGGALVHSDFVTGRSGGREDPARTLADADPEALRVLLRDLRARPPLLVLDTSTSPDLGYSAYPMSVVPEVDGFVRSRYQVEAVVDGVTVWRRQP